MKSPLPLLPKPQRSNDPVRLPLRNWVRNLEHDVGMAQMRASQLIVVALFGAALLAGGLRGTSPLVAQPDLTT